MLKYFELVLNLLDIPPKEEYSQVANYILENKQKELIVCHPLWFVFVAFVDFVNWKIDQDQFVALWDTYSHGSLEKYSVACDSNLFIDSIKYGIEKNPKQYSDKIFVISDLYCDKNQILLDNLVADLEKIWGKIFIV